MAEEKVRVAKYGSENRVLASVRRYSATRRTRLRVAGRAGRLSAWQLEHAPRNLKPRKLILETVMDFPRIFAPPKITRYTVY